MDITIEGGPAAAAALGPMKMSSRNVTSMTQKNGPADSQGNVEAEITVDEAISDSKITMNGRPMPAPAVANPVAGKTFAVIFDKLGNVVDSKGPSIPGMPEDFMPQMMKSFSGNLPTTPVGIGETAAAPLDIAIPLPLAGAQLKMDGEVLYKLLSLGKEGDDRIATIATTINGKLVGDSGIPGPNGTKIQMTLEIKMTGGGTTLSNLDKGFLKSSESQSTFGGPIRMNGGPNAAQLPSMNMQARQKITITAEN